MDHTNVDGLAGQRSVKAVMLARYERSGASSRLRLMQYAEPLESKGIVSTFEPLFDEKYLGRLYAGGSVLGSVLVAYVRRAVQLRRACHADLIWLEKEALPWLPWEFERAMLPRFAPIVVDYDDAVFHRYDQHRSILLRQLLGTKLDKLMSSAALVTAGNRYLAARAEAAGAARVEIVPTVVDLSAYTQRRERFSGEGTKIGWIGTPTTWTEYMVPLMPLLTQVAEGARARIVAVGAGRAASAHPLLDNVVWTENTEVARIQEMDIGIMPLADTPWARGKCGYKLIQYMACGIPVIASPVGVNADIVEHGVNGFLASSDTEWAKALQTLLQDPALRTKMGRKARLKVERDYSLQVWGPRVADMLRRVADEARKN